MNALLPFQRAAAPAEPTAWVDALRDRFTMLSELGHTLADEDAFVRDELVIAALSTIDAGTVATTPEERRSLFLRGAALLLTEVERMDRARAGTLAGSEAVGHA